MKKIMVLSFFMAFLGLTYSRSDELTGTGTGFFVSSGGLIVTCAHVVEDSAKITVKINNNEYQAEILKKDSNSDIAVIKIDYRNTHHFKLADFNRVNLGDAIWVLGFPLSEILGSDIRLTDGVVSAKSGLNSDRIYFQHSAPIQPGNSGGPIVNTKFEVIGVAAAKLNDIVMLNLGTIPQNVNFGVKSNYINQDNQNLGFGGGNVKTINDAEKATVQILCYEAAPQNNSLIKINNKTGFVIYYVYIKPSSSGSWGPDYLGEDVLPDNRTLTVRTPPFPENAGQCDIRIIDEDGDTYTKRNVRLSRNQTVEFTLRDIDTGDSDNMPSVTIVNKTGYTVYFVYISPATEREWGEDMLGNDEILLTGGSVTVRLSYSLNVANRYDIKLEDKDGDTYTKRNVLITPDKIIEFTINDID
jgi:hypothetical protein